MARQHVSKSHGVKVVHFLSAISSSHTLLCIVFVSSFVFFNLIGWHDEPTFSEPGRSMPISLRRKLCCCSSTPDRSEGFS